MSAYVLEFTINSLPPMANAQLRGHWRVKHGVAKVWKRKVWEKCWHLAPKEPLERARLTLVRASSVEPDTDGLISGFKHVIDGLVEARIIANDKPSNIGIPNYRYAKAGRGKGHIIVRVESVCSAAEVDNA